MLETKRDLFEDLKHTKWWNETVVISTLVFSWWLSGKIISTPSLYRVLFGL